MSLLSRVKVLWALSAPRTVDPERVREALSGAPIVPTKRYATVVPDDPIDLFPPEEPVTENTDDPAS